MMRQAHQLLAGNYLAGAAARKVIGDEFGAEQLHRAAVFHSRLALAPRAEGRLRVTIGDEVYTCRMEAFERGNINDEELLQAVRALRRGETHRTGGGGDAPVVAITRLREVA